MASPPSDETKRLFKAIADNRWHDYAEVIEQISEKVPPGKALRKYQHRLRASREFRGGTSELEIEHTEDEQIRFGARALAQGTISSWRGKGVMIRVVEGVKYIRLKPGFNVAGVLGMSAQEAGAEAQDPGFPPGGYTDPPPADSEPSESAREPVQEASGVWQSGEAPAEPEAVQQPTAAPVVEAAAEAVAPVDVDDAPGLVAEPPPSPSVKLEDLTTCTECGLLVYNEPLHVGWHKARTEELGNREMALIDESGLRTLLGDVMRLGLDQFQHGMQGWLDGRFAEVEARIVALSRLQARESRTTQSQSWST